ncbi:MAG: right-handed parallel beta-helix repeat-containing protein [Polyangiaceae bacterium]|nr:right-handed parallel beta-helix repeat-containing protein [Polyangiaceae bacterium]
MALTAACGGGSGDESGSDSDSDVADGWEDGGGADSDGSSSGSGNNGSGAGSGGPGTPPPTSGPAAVDCTHVGQGTDYQVGPGKAYENIGDVPFESLVAGDTVRIFWRDQPYHEKMMIGGVGTAEQPIRVCGVAGPDGQLPVIDGANATTRPQLDFPFDGHQVRGLVIVGHPHDRPYDEQTAHVVIEALELTGAGPPNTFTDKSGAASAYTEPAAGIFVQRADDVTVRGCDIHDNNNGIFMGTGSGQDATSRVLIEANRIYQNGSLTDWYEHNVYNEVHDVTYQFNYFGEPRAGQQGVLGANIKERSSGVVIRYNWIEDGGHLIDLVDTQEAQADSATMPSFHESHVYGNILVRNGTDKGSMVHYGGDSGEFQNYRKGTLFFYQNTLVVKNEGAHEYDAPEVFEISTNEESLEAVNNIFYSSSAPSELTPICMLGEREGLTAGIATFSNNWVSTGWSPYDQTPGNETNLTAEVNGLTSSLTGSDPGFTNAADGDYTIVGGAPVVQAGTDLSSMIPEGLAATLEYVKHQGAKSRKSESPPTMGAMSAP